eukprot:15455582-Alexandrium_andersonii.AAC.1
MSWSSLVRRSSQRSAALRVLPMTPRRQQAWSWVTWARVKGRTTLAHVAALSGPTEAARRRRSPLRGRLPTRRN